MSFQAESKKSGDDFEGLVLEDLSNRGFKSIEKNVYVPEAGVEIDFYADNREYVEAKGGYEGEKKRPGAKRTDSVKKAVANGALLKAVKPESYYVVYFSSKPKAGGSSDQMIKVALEAKIIDEVRYIESYCEITSDRQLSLF